MTQPIRACADEVDAAHPAVRERSLRAEVGGRLALVVDDREVAALWVGGPRQTQLGDLQRYRGQLRMRLVRMTSGGEPPLGADDASAKARALREIRVASAIWGQCGVHFGDDADADVAVVDPPPSHLLAVGCRHGLPASGGRIALRIGDDHLEVATRAGESPDEVGARLAQAIVEAGHVAVLSPNPPTGIAALRTVDVLVRDRVGRPLAVSGEAGAKLSSDSTLDVCLGEVDLSDGVTHFHDFDSRAGTLEERTLIKAYDDGDPRTIDVVVIPAFAEGGRIGESFVFGAHASIFNTVLIDRAGIQIGAQSFALSHEVGHVLMDLPGHPDDFGVDLPFRLMDADSADGSIFGPRRLDVAECVRALLQSGPGAPTELLQRWPFPPLP